jgi:hypothetical protein
MAQRQAHCRCAISHVRMPCGSDQPNTVIGSYSARGWAQSWRRRTGVTGWGAGHRRCRGARRRTPSPRLGAGTPDRRGRPSAVPCRPGTARLVPSSRAKSGQGRSRIAPGLCCYPAITLWARHPRVGPERSSATPQPLTSFNGTVMARISPTISRIAAQCRSWTCAAPGRVSQQFGSVRQVHQESGLGKVTTTSSPKCRNCRRRPQSWIVKQNSGVGADMGDRD